MTIRPLIITPEQREDAARIVEYAFANPYYPGDAVAPGNIPQHILIFPLGQYRAVFSLTISKGVKFRHLSVSVPGENLPSIEAMLMIGKLFGFTMEPLHEKSGLPLDWMVKASREDNCVVIGEILP